MKKVYVCSRYSGNIELNIARAKSFSQLIYSQGCLPICVHLFLEASTGLSEALGNRSKLLELGLEFIKLCDEVWVFDVDGISEGMSGEIVLAKSLGIKCRLFKNGIEVN